MPSKIKVSSCDKNKNKKVKHTRTRAQPDPGSLLPTANNDSAHVVAKALCIV